VPSRRMTRTPGRNRSERNTSRVSRVGPDHRDARSHPPATVRRLLTSIRRDPAPDPSPIGPFVLEEAMLDTKMSVKLACCMALARGAAAVAAQRGTSPAGGERGDLDEIRKVSTLIGTHVMNRSNTKVADIRDLALSPTGDVLYVVLGHGGVGGVGETY